MSANRTTEMAARMVECEGAAPESAELFAGMLLDRLQYGADGKAVVLDLHGRPAFNLDGEPVPISDLIGRFRKEIPQFFQAPKTSASSDTRTIPPGFKAPRDPTQRDADRLKAALAAGNPYRHGADQMGLTRQAVVEALDPEMAARLKSEAGAR